MRERVTLLHPVRLPDGGGGAEIAYEARAELWAAREDLGSGIDRVAGRDARLAHRRYAVRERSDLLFECRLQDGERVFRITDIRRAGGRKPYQIVTTEEVR
jgi:hypothetical protein